MTTFFCYPSSDFSGQKHQLTITICGVIFNRENNKFLLHIGKSTKKWQFVGGRYSDDTLFRESAILEAHRYIPSDIHFLEALHDPILLFDTIDLKGYEEQTVLLHYMLPIKNDKNIETSETLQWFSLEEIQLLDAKNQTSSPNIRIVTEQICAKK